MSKLLGFINSLISFNRYTHRPRSLRPYLRDLYNRRLAQGPEIYRPRSDWLNWNRNVELNAFLHRINENISVNYLEQVLTDKSYIEYMLSKSSNVPLDNILQHNEELVYYETLMNKCDQITVLWKSSIGLEFSRTFVDKYIRSVFMRFPEEWINLLTDHLLSVNNLASIAGHLGFKDLVFYSDFKDNSNNKIMNGPPSLKIIADSFMALIGVIAKSQPDRANLFVRDFILVGLNNLDLFTLINIDNPFELLTGICLSEGRGKPEPRLIHQSGVNTILSCYQVGIYSDRELIGEAPGETVAIAQEEAARQAVYAHFGITEHQHPIIFKDLPIKDTELNNISKTSISYYLRLASNRKESQ